METQQSCEGLKTIPERRTRVGRMRRVQTGDHPIRNSKIGSAFPAAIENQQLMSDQSGFSNDGTEPTRPRKSNYGDDHMKKKGEDVTHAGMVSNCQSLTIHGNWGIRHQQGCAAPSQHRDWLSGRSAIYGIADEQTNGLGCLF